MIVITFVRISVVVLLVLVEHRLIQVDNIQMEIFIDLAVHHSGIIEKVQSDYSQGDMQNMVID